MDGNQHGKESYSKEYYSHKIDSQQKKQKQINEQVVKMKVDNQGVEQDLAQVEKNEELEVGQQNGISISQDEEDNDQPTDSQLGTCNSFAFTSPVYLAPEGVDVESNANAEANIDTYEYQDTALEDDLLEGESKQSETKINIGSQDKEDVVDQASQTFDNWKKAQLLYAEISMKNWNKSNINGNGIEKNNSDENGWSFDFPKPIQVTAPLSAKMPPKFHKKIENINKYEDTDKVRCRGCFGFI